jgi:hypothetical protein
MTRLLSLLTIGALGVAIAGCGGSHCDDAVTCEGGNDSDKEACELQVEALYDQADVNGCSDLVEAWQDCMTDSASCNDGIWGRGTCDEQFRSLKDCVAGSGDVF